MSSVQDGRAKVFKALHGASPTVLDGRLTNSLPLPVDINYGRLTPSHV